MNNARDRILAKLKGANASAQRVQDLPFQPWGFDNKKSDEEKLTRFCDALTASHAEVQQITEAQLSETLQQLCSEKSWRRAVIGTEGEFLAQFQQGLNNADIIEYTNEIEQWKTELFHEVDVGVTHVLAGIADTGALVLWPSVHEPRTLSLVPPCHVAVIKASTLYNHFLQVIEVQNWRTNMPTNALLITGPSKTADIQQTLAYGAHGPSELVVLIVNDK